jgi:hypothetical protein
MKADFLFQHSVIAEAVDAGVMDELMCSEEDMEMRCFETPSPTPYFTTWQLAIPFEIQV